MSSNNPNRVYLDTETTGLHPEEGDEILSLTIVDANGRLLFDERFKPKHKKEWPEAQAVNHISPDDVEHLTTIDAYMEQRVDVLATPTDDVFISVSPDAVLRQYPDITIDEAIQIRDNACENIWESGGQSDLDEIVWDQIGAEYKSIKSDSHRGLSDVKDAKAKQAVHVNDDRKNDAVALDMQEK